MWHKINMSNYSWKLLSSLSPLPAATGLQLVVRTREAEKACPRLRLQRSVFRWHVVPSVLRIECVVQYSGSRVQNMLNAQATQKREVFRNVKRYDYLHSLTRTAACTFHIKWDLFSFGRCCRCLVMSHVNEGIQNKPLKKVYERVDLMKPSSATGLPTISCTTDVRLACSIILFTI